jgi:hypothetical protein
MSYPPVPLINLNSLAVAFRPRKFLPVYPTVHHDLSRIVSPRSSTKCSIGTSPGGARLAQEIRTLKSTVENKS